MIAAMSRKISERGRKLVAEHAIDVLGTTEDVDTDAEHEVMIREAEKSEHALVDYIVKLEAVVDAARIMATDWSDPIDRHDFEGNATENYEAAIAALDAEIVT